MPGSRPAHCETAGGCLVVDMEESGLPAVIHDEQRGVFGFRARWVWVAVLTLGAVGVAGVGCSGETTSFPSVADASPAEADDTDASEPADLPDDGRCPRVVRGA